MEHVVLNSCCAGPNLINQATGSWCARSVGLCTAQPEEDGSNDHEVFGGNYARASVDAGDWNSAGFDAGVNSYVDNKNVVEFNEASAGWGIVTHFSIYDASDTLILWGSILPPKEIPGGSVPKFEANSLKVLLG